MRGCDRWCSWCRQAVWCILSKNIYFRVARLCQVQSQAWRCHKPVRTDMKTFLLGTRLMCLIPVGTVLYFYGRLHLLRNNLFSLRLRCISHRCQPYHCREAKGECVSCLHLMICVCFFSFSSFVHYKNASFHSCIHDTLPIVRFLTFFVKCTKATPTEQPSYISCDSPNVTHC